MKKNNINALLSIIMRLLPDEMLREKVFNPPNTNKELIKNMENLFIAKSKTNIDVYGVIIKSKVKTSKYIIFSHSTSNDIYEAYELMENFGNKHNVNIICYDYPGYGLTSSNNGEYMNENKCYECHETIINYALNDLNINPKDIVLIGHSLGTGVVVDWISKNEWTGNVILISPYKSIPRILFDNELVDENINKYQFNSIGKIHNAKCPIKIFAGSDDELIPLYHAQELYDNMVNKKYDIEIIPGCKHADIIFNIDENIIKSLIN